MRAKIVMIAVLGISLVLMLATFFPAFGKKITISWDPGVSEGYEIGMGSSPGNYSEFGTVGSVNTYDLPSTVYRNGEVCYIAVRAIASDNFKSDYSNEIAVAPGGYIYLVNGSQISIVSLDIENEPIGQAKQFDYPGRTPVGYYRDPFCNGYILWNEVVQGSVNIILSVLSIDNDFVFETVFSYPVGWLGKVFEMNNTRGIIHLENAESGAAKVLALDKDVATLWETTLGPYPGFSVKDLFLNEDGTIMGWRANTAGQAVLFLLDENGAIITTNTKAYGPYTGWTPTHLFSNRDRTGKMRWQEVSGQILVVSTTWTNDLLNNKYFGPYAGWEPLDYLGFSDNTGKFYGENASASLVLVASGSETNLAVQNKYYTPYGYSMLKIAKSRDGTATLLRKKKPGGVVYAPAVVQSFDSEQSPYLNRYAIDGNSSTMWCTQYIGANPSHPHYMVLDLGSLYSIGGLRYLPRQDGSLNAIITRYEIYISEDNATWGAAVASGVWAGNAIEKEILFSEKNGRYVKFVSFANATGINADCVAELKVMKTQSDEADRIYIMSLDPINNVLGQNEIVLDSGWSFLGFIGY